MVGYFRSVMPVIGLLVIISLTFSCRQGKDNKNREQTELDTIATLPPPVLKYGLPVDSFLVVDGTVRPNQHLSHILSNYGVGMGTIDQIARQSKDVFDVRKIRGGNRYSIFQTADSLAEARYFVYENSATDYFIFQLFDSLQVSRGEKEVETRLRTGCGEIESSLWNTMKDNGLDPMLALKLSDIFAWSIDFYAIQKGDRFRVIYDELFVDSTSIGIGNIYAVQFDHYGSENYAFRFFQDDRFDYFDDKGLSLRKAFLKSPLEFSARISSRFSHSRMHPVLRIRRPHHGVDYAAPKGTPVRTIGDGTVISRAYQARGGGNYLKIKHNSVYTTTYMHLSGFAKGVVQGARVQQGQVIGFVGATGLATGPHLDFRVHKNGTPVDPLKVEAPPVEPVHENLMPEYTALKDSLLGELHKIIWDTKILADVEQE
ncbi:Murein DD-endopeptidase MepM and murein hydrolase activator NlpD, contain LysM domain [Mariniphaga anaerophila]|uniref:Murein DD-endopeptidase MepM and murein hydrolase activator NlpD, contain LysM domain n=1 Tax=Mariniphaga anaerophila TaxID=1484053 RepID=A0A1M5DHN2_9BACT|nr:peptidoglycan DD-metalloendopeptidase family protein [Mariniphaga anaerophila]SHF66523.1 Murein DD-endopeptidase MepM and murein hydrolase activator NlpD, contain LysM domain [Mariniphaga anaerophila]